MAWSWSHTQQAYADAEENLRNLPKETLEIIFAEWRAAQGKHGVIDPVSPDFNERKYERALKHAKTLAHDTLADIATALAQARNFFTFPPSGVFPHRSLVANCARALTDRPCFWVQRHIRAGPS